MGSLVQIFQHELLPTVPQRRRELYRIIAPLIVLFMVSAAHAAILENPTHNALYSGIGIISGWKCESSGELTVRFNEDDPIPLVYGSRRSDTRSVCGDDDNGFVAIWNWSKLGDGTHTAVVYDDGVEFARSIFDVATTGEEFLRGASAQVWIDEFPAPGERTRFVWNQSTQHLELAEVTEQPDSEEEEDVPQSGNGATEQPGNEEEEENPQYTLHIVAGNGDAEAVRALIANGADVNERIITGGDTPLHRAASGGTAEVVEILLEAGALVNARNTFGDAPLHHAARNENSGEITRALLAGGADLYAGDSDESTPLHWAAREGSLDMVLILLAEGVDVNTQAQWGDTPLHYAAWGENAEVIRLLLDAGADVNARTSRGDTPLHHSAGSGNAEVVRLLLDAGADINARGSRGNTPLHQATHGRNIEVLRMLLNAGADVHAQNKDGDTPFALAEKYSTPEVVEFLRNEGGAGERPCTPKTTTVPVAIISGAEESQWSTTNSCDGTTLTIDITVFGLIFNPNFPHFPLDAADLMIEQNGRYYTSTSTTVWTRLLGWFTQDFSWTYYDGRENIEDYFTLYGPPETIGTPYTAMLRTIVTLPLGASLNFREPFRVFYWPVIDTLDDLENPLFEFP